jgi:hypothetical protein
VCEKQTVVATKKQTMPLESPNVGVEIQISLQTWFEWNKNNTSTRAAIWPLLCYNVMTMAT